MSAPFKLAKGLRIVCDCYLGGGIAGLAFYGIWMVWLLVSPAVMGKRQIISDSVTVAIGEPGLPGVFPVSLASDNSKLNVSPRLFFTTGDLQFQTNDLKIQIAVYLAKRLLLGAWIVELLYMTRQFLADAIDGSIFTMDNARRLKWIGWLLLGIGLAKPVWDSLFGQWILSMVRVQNTTLSAWPDVLFLFIFVPIACFVLILSAVFRHGVELENEHALTV